MDKRTNAIDAFLAKTIWRDWTRLPMTGDASARRYFKLRNTDQSVILMDAPPETNDSTQPFVDIAQLLTSHGLCAPHIVAHDVENGLMVLSDLGQDDFASWLQKHPNEGQHLYQSAADILIRVQEIIPPDTLIRMTPEIGAEMIMITGEYYVERDLSDLRDTLRTALEEFAPDANTLALRDYHAENLIWRAHHTGTGRVGLLDFQDAFVAPAGYDLASLLRDARRDVPPSIVDETITYFSKKSQTGPDFRTQIACLGVQRNLRILGVFARLSKEMGKPRYLQFMPRIWANIMADLDDPALTTLRKAVLDTISAPTSAYCESLQS